MDYIWIIGRVFFALLFIGAGIKHIRIHSGMVEFARSMGQPFSYLAGWPAGVFLLTASLGVVLGVWIDLALIALFGWLLLTAVLYHAWWEEDPYESAATLQYQMFMKNLALSGAALQLIAITYNIEPSFMLTKTLF